jgi:hypothetical protein
VPSSHIGIIGFNAQIELEALRLPELAAPYACPAVPAGTRPPIPTGKSYSSGEGRLPARG